MNILLTNRCNRRCSYCFAQERVSSDAGSLERPAPEFIDIADFERALGFAKKGGQRSIGLLGGEPSLHPRFEELLELAWSHKLHTKVFTNGLWRQQSVEWLRARRDERKRQVNLVVNINEPSRTPAAQQRHQATTLSRLGSLCSLSFNISHIDFDPLFLVDTIERYGLRPNIRLGVAQPLARMEAEHVAVEHYPLLAPALMSLAERCDQADIVLGFDCGFTLCMFEPEQLGRLQLAGVRFRSVCGPAVDVGTDLSAWACFPLSTFAGGERVDEQQDLDSLVKAFERRYEPLFSAGVMERCVECRHRRRGQCSGGCAAHVYRQLDPNGMARENET